MELKRIFPVFIAVISGVLFITSCAGSNNTHNTNTNSSASDSSALVMDSVNVANTISVGNCTGLCSINLEYPVGGNHLLVDSLRNWIDSQLNISGQNFSSALDVAKYAVNLKLDSMSKDLSGIIHEFHDYKANYEAQWCIGTVYSTDKILTLFSNQYIYEGGAHGSTLYSAATFKTSDGEMLGWNMFKPEFIPELTQLVKDSIINQYFENADNFKENILIPENEFVLPVSAPVMVDGGVSFTYQQYELASYAAGMPSCVIPYSTLSTFFADGIEQLAVK